MKNFSLFVKEGKVKKHRKDVAQAISLFNQAKERIADVSKLPLNETNASFRFESAYEALREALQSFLAKEGYKPYSHEAVFIFAYERKLLTQSETRKANRFREIRNNINYTAEKVTVDEAIEIISFVKTILPKLKKKAEGGTRTHE